MTFSGIRPVLHTPFGPGPDEPVLEAEVRGLARAMADAGVSGVVVLGLASEASAVGETERDLVIGAAIEAIPGLPVVVGIDGPTRIARERATRARELGAAGLMVLPPAGARSSAALVRHFADVADVGGLPVLVQDSPQVSGVTLDLDTILALARAHPLVGALKVEVAGAGAKTSAAHEAGIEIVAGWGGLQYLESIRRGAMGCMPGCDLAPAFVGIDRLARTADQGAAEESYRTILPLLSYEAQSLDLLLLGAKRHLVRRGLFSSGRLRSPGRELDPQEAASLDALLDRLERDGVPGFARTEVSV